MYYSKIMSEPKFKVVPVTDSYKVKTYSQWIADWANWFYMQYPDQYNSEPWNDVKFLTSFPSPDKIAQMGKPGEKVRYEGSEFRNIPNIKIGDNKLVMYEDQAIFFPVILATWVNSDEKDYGYMERWVKNQNSVSDDPPPVHQFTLDNLPLLPSEKVINHRIMSNGIFQLNIPDAPYGTSLKDFVLEPSLPGWYGAICEGYFFLITDLKAKDTPYLLTSFATGAPYAVGEYHAAFVYEIKVLSRELKPRPPVAGIFPERILDIIDKEVNSIHSSKEDIDQINKVSEVTEDFRKADLGYTRFSVNNRKAAQEYAISLLVLGNVKRKIAPFIKSRKMSEKIDIDRIKSMIEELEESISPSFNEPDVSNKPEKTIEGDVQDPNRSLIIEVLENEKKSTDNPELLAVINDLQDKI